MRQQGKTTAGLLITLLWAGACALSAGAANGEDAKGPGGAPAAPPQVTVITVTSRTMPLSFDYVGTVEPSKSVEVRARIKGFIEKRNFEEGAMVRAGDELYLIDPRSFEADLNIQKASLAQAHAQRALAEKEISRQRSLLKSGGVSQSDVDKQQAALDEAIAQGELCEAQIAKAALELSYTSVKAPLSGLIGKTEKEIGSLVDDGNNSLLATIVQTDPIYVSFQVSEADYISMRKRIAHQEITLEPGIAEPYAKITLLDGTTLNERGKLNYQDPKINEQIGAIEYRAEFTNPKHALKPGMYVKAHLLGWTQPNAVSVPQRAVAQSAVGAYVYVIGKGNTLEFRPVGPGVWSGQDWIIDSGLRAGDRVVVDGAGFLLPGTPVTPVAAAAKPAAEGAQQ